MGCRKKALDDYYNRPESLAMPIYQQLDSMGRFTKFLALIDKSGYKATLSSAGSWTCFAPNDSAFVGFMKERGISDISTIDSATAQAMVQYLLVFNSFKKDRLDDYQATANDAGWTPSQAFRRRTAYYTSFYQDTGVNGKAMVAVASNRNGLTYYNTDFNNKYISYFTDDYFSTHGLSATDYNYFYPASQYTGFNVAQAKVITKDIEAENGTIHEIDKVVTPLQSIDEYIRTRPEYSSFRAMLNRLNINNTVLFAYVAEATRRYQILKGKNDSVFVKLYSNLLAFSPNNENLFKIEDNDGQKDCWTMFIPNNQAVDAFVKNVLLEYYPSLDQMPNNIIFDFLNSHLFATAVWPTKFATTRNSLSEPARFDPVADVFDRKMLSNGMLYGTTKVQQADVFSTVFSKAYLNPNYMMMTRLLNLSGLRVLVANSTVPTDLLLVSDKVFADSGYTYNAAKDQFEYKPLSATASTTSGVYDKLIRIVQACVFFEPYKTQVDNLSSADIVKSGSLGIEGDYMKFNNNVIVTAGLQDLGKTAKVDSVKIGTNGKAYFISAIPYYSDKPVGTHVKALGSATTSDFNSFWLFLASSTFYNTVTTELNGLTGFNTLFVPNNAAIKQAVNDGLLPGTGTAPNKVATYAPTAVADIDLVRKFLQYHILADHTIVPDGQNTGVFNSFLKNSVGTAIPFTVTGTRGAMSIIDNYGRKANVITNSSNNLSNRCVIHLIDNYLKYNYN